MPATACEASREGYSLAYREARMGLEDQERAVVEFAVLLVLWPRRDWEFSLAPDHFIATYLEPAHGGPLALHLIERDLALHMGRSAEQNRRQLGMLMGVFRVGAVLLVAEVLAWVVALVVQR